MLGACRNQNAARPFLCTAKEDRKNRPGFPAVWKTAAVPFLGYLLTLGLCVRPGLQFSNMLIFPENQAYTDPRKPKNGEQERRAASFPGAKQTHKHAFTPLCCHNRLKYLIHQQSSQEITQRDGEELEGIPGGKHTALYLHRDVQPVDGIQIGVHPGNVHPAQSRTKAPQPLAVSKCQDTSGKHGDATPLPPISKAAILLLQQLRLLPSESVILRRKRKPVAKRAGADV